MVFVFCFNILRYIKYLFHEIAAYAALQLNPGHILEKTLSPGKLINQYRKTQ